MTNKTEPPLPLRAILWYLIVEPLKPPDRTEGGIYLADDAKEAEEIMITVGKIVALGSLCFTGRTMSGLCLADETDKPKLGDYVLYQRYTGQKLKFRDGRTVILMQDHELLAKVDDPSNLRYHI